jgi:MinD superfamily P-loop ATPase
MSKELVIAVASGKGGTGKTTVATNLFLSIENAELLDCDVEEPNAHLFLSGTAKEDAPVFVPIPVVDESRCTGCGVCQKVCNFNALAVISKHVLVFKELCHSCGACVRLCPEKCISEESREIGRLKKWRVENRRFIYGELAIGGVMAPPLIRAVRKERDPAHLTIIDAPPGAACPMVSAVKESDYCILVTEPTPFGLHDLKIAVRVVKEAEIPCGVILNRSEKDESALERFCKDEEIPVLLKIPFDRRIAHWYSTGVPIVTAMPEYREKFEDVIRQIRKGVRR